MAILTGLITVLAHRSYSLIGHLPEHVFRWIGEGVFGMGESGDIQKTERSTTAAVGAVVGMRGAAKAAGGRPGAATQAMAETTEKAAGETGGKSPLAQNDRKATPAQGDMGNF